MLFAKVILLIVDNKFQVLVKFLQIQNHSWIYKYWFYVL